MFIILTMNIFHVSGDEMGYVKYEIFNKVVEVGNFTKAGLDLNMTQSAISHAISSLEKEFGFPLFHRGKNGVTITQEGEIMLQRIRQVLTAEELVQQEAANIIGVTKGKVRVGTFSSISMKWLPFIIQQMERNFPGIQIELKEGDYFQIEQMLSNGEVDCGFINNISSSQFQFIPLIRDEIVLIASENSKFYHKNQVEIESVQEEPFILSTYNGTNDILTIFDKYNVKPNIRFELFDERAIVAMVENGLGITMLPKLVLKNIPKNVRVIPIKEESYRIIGLAMRYQISPATKMFVKELKNWLATNEKVAYIQ